MKKLLLPLLFLFIFVPSYAQVERPSAQGVWERYKIAAAGVSFVLPKMPVRQDDVDPCRELRSSKFFAYTEGAVYEFTLYEELANKSRYKCYETLTPFSEYTFKTRLDELAKPDVEVLGSKTEIEGRTANRIVAPASTRLVISEMDEHNRWIELAVHHHPGDSPNFDRFLNSIEFSAGSGKEIGYGVDTLLGDRLPTEALLLPPAKTDPTQPGKGQGSGYGTGAGIGTGSGSSVVSGSGSGQGQGNGPGPGSSVGSAPGAGSGSKFEALNDGPVPAVPTKSDPYRTISQPKARYTDLARKNDVQGAVRLKITLLANGSVGSVVVVTSLADGLTENAIAAAKRIVFLPKRVNGIPVSVVVTREYTFTIY